MSLIEEIFGDKARRPREPSSPQPGERTPADRARDLISEAKKVDKFEAARGVRAPSDTRAAEEFRALCTNLMGLDAAQGINSIVLSSCHQGEGRTTAAINLALSMAKGPYRKVLLFEGDLRSPVIKQRLSLQIEVGVEDVLTGTARVGEALVYSREDNLTVLPARGGYSDPAEMLDSPAMEELAPMLVAAFDYVICDSPPLSTPDSFVLGRRMGALALVVRAGETQRQSVTDAVSILKQADVPFAGLILNRVKTRGAGRPSAGQQPD